MLNINWKLLSEQKNVLLHSAFCDTEAGTGILHLIDGLQDEAVKNGVPKKTVFIKQPELPQEQTFPNGFTAWQETHYEVVQHLTGSLDTEGSAAYLRQQSQGHGGLYELAEELTNQFERKYRDVEWGMDIEFFDTVEEFLSEADKNKKA